MSDYFATFLTCAYTSYWAICRPS